MKYYAFILPLLLTAQITTSSISSKKASYDGNALVLNGNVSLDHTLGKLQSSSARLQKEGKEGPFSLIFLRDDVLITLKNRGKISCATADFDFNAMKGKLIPALGKAIHFTNLHADLLSLSSQEAEIEFANDSDSIKISKIQANGVVHAQYGYDFFLHADSALYSNETIPYVSASPNCKLTHKGDQITADKVEFFPDSSKIIFSTPKGNVKPSAFSDQEGIRFSCNKMIWEKAPQLLTLLGDVSVHDESIGDIHCDDEVELMQHQQEGKWILSSVTTKGKTELSYQLNADFKHLLVCYGRMHLDQKKLLLTLESTKEKPIEYFHDKMKLCADYAQLDYIQGEQKVLPQCLSLTGNVRLSAEQNEKRCALADQFHYYPAEEKMILSSKDGSHVLFWDEQQQLTVSAREVHISRINKKDNIKGVGNVRFAFSSAENDLMKKLFPFYRPKGGSL